MTSEWPGRFETIVVTTDGSPFSLRAVEVGFKIAKEHKSKLIVVTVVDTGIIKDFTEAPRRERDRVERELEHNCERTLKDVGAIAKDLGVDVEMIVRRGRPHTEIIRVADDAEADLIVLAKGGSHRGDRYLMGSTGQRVIEDAECSILIVK
ncbi:MAG: universal stress protein [Candidatus Coatesbacteria bacterium]|nr:MAG: universal stress protein [Candidatus Coatesbacteria bacterium]